MSRDSNRFFLISFASLAMFGLSHEIPEAKKQVEGIALNFFGVPRTGGFLDLEFQYLWTTFVDAKFLPGSSPHLSTHYRLFKCWCHNFQNFDFWGAKIFSKFLFPFRSVGFWLRAWAMGPRLPEASHRCIRQPRTATMGSSSGFSRPRRPWMRRTKTAVASDEGFGEKNLLRQWDLYLRKWMKCWFDSRFYFIFVFTFYGKCQSKHVHHDCVLFFVVTIFHDCVLCPPPVALFCGPTLGSDFAPEFGECPL